MIGYHNSMFARITLAAMVLALTACPPDDGPSPQDGRSCLSDCYSGGVDLPEISGCEQQCQECCGETSEDGVEP